MKPLRELIEDLKVERLAWARTTSLETVPAQTKEDKDYLPWKLTWEEFYERFWATDEWYPSMEKRAKCMIVLDRLLSIPRFEPWETDKPVMAGNVIFDLVDTHGLPLMIILSSLHDERIHVNWLGFISTALCRKWKTESIRSRMLEAFLDVYGKNVANTISGHLSEILSILTGNIEYE